MIINIERFIRAERPYWEELERALSAEAPPRDAAAAQRLFYLYRRAATDLVRLNSLAASAELHQYVETLVARAYAQIYAGESPPTRLRPVHWFLREFPRAVRANHRALWFSVALTLLGSLFGASALLYDANMKATLLPFSHLHGSPSDRVAEEERAQAEGDAMSGDHAEFAGMLMSNNIRVSFFAAALGLTYALGTIILLFYNGVILGVVSLDYVLDGQSVFLLGWLLPHGAVEIPSILFGGQAGMMLGSALLGYDGAAPLRERMRLLMPDLLYILFGIVVLLVWAGIVEAFISQYHEPTIPYVVKILFGLLELALLGFLLYAGGRAPKGGQAHG